MWLLLLSMFLADGENLRLGDKLYRLDGKEIYPVVVSLPISDYAKSHAKYVLTWEAEDGWTWMFIESLRGDLFATEREAKVQRIRRLRQRIAELQRELKKYEREQAIE